MQYEGEGATPVLLRVATEWRDTHAEAEDREGRERHRDGVPRDGVGLAVLGLDRQVDHRVGHVDRGHGDALLAAGERIARRAVDAEQGHDVARGRLLDVFHVVRVHPNQTADLDLLGRVRATAYLLGPERW